MDYRHLTNLRTPLDIHDRTMLVVLQEYHLGDPVQAHPSENVEPVDVPTMKSNGVVGLYVTLAAAVQAEFKQLTGWEITPEAWAGGPLLS